jgi:ribonuclease T2
MTRLLISLALLALLYASPLAARGTPGKFDYWTMVLSWSPSYCNSSSGQRDRQQCGRGRAYAFVAHGLWPQYDRGWPEYCSRKPEWISRDVLRAMTDIMPSNNLIIHEWKKHGVCSGLKAKRYFALTRKIFATIKIPPRFKSPNNYIQITPGALKKAFLNTNPQLRANMISVQCGGRRDRATLRGLRICYDRNLKPRTCGVNEQRACRARTLTLPPVRIRR